MAIENAKTLNVRIRNKYDSYENWMKSSLILESGEIATCHTTIDVKVENGIAKHPALLMKVGNGTDTFDKLPWLSARAADVAEWAKAAEKPVYAATEITGISDYIADYVSTEMGIEVDTDTQYQLIKVDGYNYKLQSKGKGDAAWADVANSVITIPNDTDAIEALQDNIDALSDKVGTVAEGKTVVEMIAAVSKSASDYTNEVQSNLNEAIIARANAALTDAKTYAKEYVDSFHVWSEF